jgi:hypothetical protein
MASVLGVIIPSVAPFGDLEFVVRPTWVGLHYKYLIVSAFFNAEFGFIKDFFTFDLYE